MSSPKSASVAASSTLSSSQQQQLDHLPPSEQLCYVHCTICDTVLAVSVPCSSLFKTVTVRCGHCTNLLPVNMRALLLPNSQTQQFHPSFFSHPPFSHNLLQDPEIPLLNPSCPANLVMNNQAAAGSLNDFALISRPPRGSVPDDLIIPRPPIIRRPPEKRQRVPSAYNRFIKDEIQRIKSMNPGISHREAFSAAAKNWAHFPHIHFGLMPDQTSTTVVKKTNVRQQESVADDQVLMKDHHNAGFFAAVNNNVRVSPY